MPVSSVVKFSARHKRGRWETGLPLLMTLPSTYHSPRTVKRKAMVLTMGTVKLSSGGARTDIVSLDRCWPGGGG